MKTAERRLPEGLGSMPPLARRGRLERLRPKLSMKLKFYALALPILVVSLLLVVSSVLPFRSAQTRLEEARGDVVSTIQAERLARQSIEAMWHVVYAVVSGDASHGNAALGARIQARTSLERWLADERDRANRVSLRRLGLRMNEVDEAADHVLALVERNDPEAETELQSLLAVSGEVGIALDRLVRLSEHELRDAFVVLAGNVGAGVVGLGSSLSDNVVEANRHVEEVIVGSEFLRWAYIVPIFLGQYLSSTGIDPGGVLGMSALATNQLENWTALANNHGDKSDVPTTGHDRLASATADLEALVLEVVGLASQGQIDEAQELYSSAYAPALAAQVAVAEDIVQMNETEVHRATVAVAADARRAQMSGIGVAGLLLLAAVATALAARRMSRRVLRLRSAATAIGVGDLSARVPVESSDELATLATSFNAMVRSLSSERERSSKLLERMVETAEHERTQLAAELHDGPVQRLTGILYTIERTWTRSGSAEPVADVVNELRTLCSNVQSKVSEEIRGLRNLMSELRPPALDQRGLGAAIGDYVRGFGAKSGIEAEVDLDIPDRLAPAVETTIYRVVQEALANVAKHSRAGRVTVQAGVEGSDVRFRVSDDGIGFDVAQAQDNESSDHFGLVGMRERVTIAGGRWKLESRPGSGTTITVSFPSWGQDRG